MTIRVKVVPKKSNVKNSNNFQTALITPRVKTRSMAYSNKPGTWISMRRKP